VVLVTIAVLVAIAVSFAVWENRSNAEIAFHIVVKMQFRQFKNLSDAVVSLRIGRTENHMNAKQNANLSTATE